jgi:hypothetical protein
MCTLILFTVFCAAGLAVFFRLEIREWYRDLTGE